MIAVCTGIVPLTVSKKLFCVYSESVTCFVDWYGCVPPFIFSARQHAERAICRYISERVSDRGIVTMEDEYYLRFDKIQDGG